MAEKFYEIKIDDVFLTESGAAANSTNLLCKLQLQGANRLRSNYKRIRLPDSIDGDPIFQVVEVGSKGKQLTITIGVLLTSVLTSVIEIIENQNETGETCNIVGTGATGNFNVSCVPDEIPYEFGEFKGNRVRNVVLRFVTE